MTTDLLARILRESDAADLLTILSERLSPTDLQSLLMEVYRTRAVQQTPARLLEQYEQNRFVRPSPFSPQTLLEFDRLAFSLAAPLFQPLELAPVCPLGTTSVVTSVSQNNTISTVRNTELVADSTNVMALECAVRRRAHLQSSAEKRTRVRLCSSHRLLRTQHYRQPGSFAHFRIFGLCSAGRDEGDYRFEQEELLAHLRFYLSLLSTLQREGYTLHSIRLALTDFDGNRQEPLCTGILTPLRNEFSIVTAEFAPERTSGRGYYEGVCFHIYATDRKGEEHQLVDGGFTTWTQQLLSNQKERLLISGLGSERVCSLFGKEAN